MIRYKTFNSTGIPAPGVLFAGDLNAIQDAAAAQADLTQTIDLATLRIGETGLQLIKYGTGEARLTGAFRTDGIIRGLGGFIPGAFTTAQRNAIASGLAPYGIAILNSQTNTWEWNQGSDASRDWQPISRAPDGVTLEFISNVIRIKDGGVSYAKIAGALKPSGTAAITDEALRALGTGAGNATAGNDVRVTGAWRIASWTEITSDFLNTGAAISMSADVVGDGAKDYMVEVFSENMYWTSGGNNGNVTAWVQQSTDSGTTWQTNGVKVGGLSTPDQTGTLAAKIRKPALAAGNYRWRLALTGTNGTPGIRAGTGADNTTAPAYLAVWVRG